jgi:hypothetical protein
MLPQSHGSLGYVEARLDTLETYRLNILFYLVLSCVLPSVLDAATIATTSLKFSPRPNRASPLESLFDLTILFG